MPLKGNVLTGCRAVFAINGVTVGYATGVSASESTEFSPVEVLDNLEVAEFVPLAYRCSLGCSRVRLIGDTLKSNGWFADTGKDSVAHLLNVLNASEMTATLSDRKTAANLITAQGVYITEHSFTVSPRGIVSEDVTMVVRRFTDETE